MDKERTTDRDVLHAAFREAEIVFFIIFTPKTSKSQQKKQAPGHKQIMEIRRQPEVALKTISPVRKEARWTISPEQIECHVLIVEENTPVNMFS